MLKIFDWVLLILFESELQTDQNQFGFEKGCSTGMCSWTAVEVVNYFARKGSSVYAALLDYRKAFDLVNHVKMFRNLIGRGINFVFIRMLISIYLFQRCYIKWQSSRSYSFSVTNGTRQGSIFSPKGGFNTYLDPMLQSLRDSGFGCSIGKHFFGVLAYADDVLILATSVQGLQRMVDLCQSHAEQNNLLFSTDPDPKKSKTMCVAFCNSDKVKLAPVMLNGNALPWVSKTKHIGNILHESGSTDQDLKQKKGMFIQTAMDLNTEFLSLSPDVKMKLNLLYNSHFTGSNIWNLESEEASRLYSSWNKNVKILFDLPWATHRWVLEELTGKNLKTMLLSRFVKFTNSIMKTNKPSIKFLLATVKEDVRSTTGANLRCIMKNFGVQVVPGSTPGSVLKATRVHKVPDGDEWKVPLLHSLLKIREGEWVVGFNEEEDEDNLQMQKEFLDFVAAG